MKISKYPFLEIIGAARNFNRAQRAISESSLQSLIPDDDEDETSTPLRARKDSNHFDTVFNDDQDEEVVIGEFLNINRNNLHVYNRTNL